MLTTIGTDLISLCVNTVGAEMMELASHGGTQYLWSGDPAYWGNHAINLFPYVGRLQDNRYCYKGKPYSMNIHGFARTSEFEIVEKSKDRVKFQLLDNAATLAEYPFSFEFCVEYSLAGNSVQIDYSIKNRSSQPMPFGLGGHPGFRLPLEEGVNFSDYYLEFDIDCKPWRVGFSDRLLLNGRDTPFQLEKDRVLALEHSLFDNDAIVLKDMARAVTLKSDKANKAIHLSYPDMPYLGIWHTPNTKAPFICIEPWLSLPSRDGVHEELLCKNSLITLTAGETYHNKWTISVF